MSSGSGQVPCIFLFLSVLLCYTHEFIPGSCVVFVANNLLSNDARDFWGYYLSPCSPVHRARTHMQQYTLGSVDGFPLPPGHTYDSLGLSNESNEDEKKS